MAFWYSLGFRRFANRLPIGRCRPGLHRPVMRLARRTRQRAALAFMRWPIRFCRPLRPARCRCSGPPSNTRRSAGGRSAGTDNSAACRGRLVPHSSATNRFAESTNASSASWHWKVNRSIRGCRWECGRCVGRRSSKNSFSFLSGTPVGHFTSNRLNRLLCNALDG